MAKFSNSSRSKYTGIAVLEAKWSWLSNVSVRGLFDLVATIHTENPNTYHYEMITSKAAAKEAIPRAGNLKAAKILSIISHGAEGKIDFINGEFLSSSDLIELLDKIYDNYVEGLYLGGCSIGGRKFADNIFSSGTKIRWIAGYSKDVDWIDSSAFELLFFNELLTHKDEFTPSKYILNVARNLRRKAAGLTDELGFGIYVRKPAVGGIKDLISEDIDFDELA